MTAMTAGSGEEAQEIINQNNASAKKTLVVTYEFTYSPFSGNGILARSLVKSLLSLGCTVTVWCCRPDYDPGNSNDNHLTTPEVPDDAMGRLTVISNNVKGNWKRLDEQSCWKEFSIANLSDDQAAILEDKLSSGINASIVIDWHGSVAYRSLRDSGDFKRPCFLLYMNFRVYSLGMTNQAQRDWFDDKEIKAIQEASTIVALSSKDVDYLQQLQKQRASSSSPIEIVLPPLRQDMEQLARHATVSDLYDYLPRAIKDFRYNCYCRDMQQEYIPEGLMRNRPLLTCVARQSAEKCVKRFVQFVQQAKDCLNKVELQVVLAGAASDAYYARQVREQLLHAIPSAIIIDRFLTPRELAAVFQWTALNFHPPAYDAYGMTVVEAAAFGAPTVLAGPSIGAFRLLREDGCLQVEMPDDEWSLPQDSVNAILKFLQNHDEWEQISTTARDRALKWGEQAYGKRLLEIIDDNQA